MGESSKRERLGLREDESNHLLTRQSNFEFECKRCTILVDYIKLTNLKLAVVLEMGCFVELFVLCFLAIETRTKLVEKSLTLNPFIRSHTHNCPK